MPTSSSSIIFHKARAWHCKFQMDWLYWLVGWCSRIYRLLLILIKIVRTMSAALIFKIFLHRIFFFVFYLKKKRKICDSWWVWKLNITTIWPPFFCTFFSSTSYPWKKYLQHYLPIRSLIEGGPMVRIHNRNTYTQAMNETKLSDILDQSIPPHRILTKLHGCAGFEENRRDFGNNLVFWTLWDT